MSFLVVFDSSGSSAAVKIDLLICPWLLWSWHIIFLLSRSVTVLERPGSENFFLGEWSFRNLFTVSIWRPVISAITSRKVPLAYSLIMIYFSLMFWAYPRPISARYSKKLWSSFTSKTDKMQMDARHDAQYHVNKRNSAIITCLISCMTEICLLKTEL